MSDTDSPMNLNENQDGAESVPPPQWRPEPAIAMMLDLAHDLKRANAQLTAERDRARDLAAALEAELAGATSLESAYVAALRRGDTLDERTILALWEHARHE